MRRILFLVIFLCFPGVLLADTSTPAVPDKPKIGQGAADFDNAFSSSLKTGLYFMAGLLLAFGAWKKFGESKIGGQQKLISIVSRTTVGPRAGLIVAEVEGERFLLSHTPDCISLISKLNSAGFDQVLDQELSNNEV